MTTGKKTAHPRSAWIEPGGITHKLFYGSHAATVRRVAPEIAESAKMNSSSARSFNVAASDNEVNEAAYRAGWLLVTWLGNESSPAACEILDKSGTGSIPDRQIDSWLRWCEEMNVKPSLLGISKSGSARSKIWGGVL